MQREMFPNFDDCPNNRNLFETPKAGDRVEGGFWDGAEIISVYTRRQAIEDGVLCDLTANFPELCKNAGIVVPVACTSAVFENLIALTPKAEEMGNDITGRAWDVLWMLRDAIRRSRDNGPELFFELRVVTTRKNPTRVVLKCHSGPGDNGEHVLTIMYPHED